MYESHRNQDQNTRRSSEWESWWSRARSFVAARSEGEWLMFFAGLVLGLLIG